MEELEQRLGVSGRLVGSPVVEDLSRQPVVQSAPSPSLDCSPASRKLASTHEDAHPSQSMRSPGSYAAIRLGKKLTGSPTRTVAATGMKQKSSLSSLRETPSSAVKSTPSRLSHPSTCKHSVNDDSEFGFREISPLPPRTPDLMSDVSDTTTQSSLDSDSPPKLNVEDLFSTRGTYMTGCNSSSAWRDVPDTPEVVIAEETAGQVSTCTPDSTRSRVSPSGKELSFVSPLTSRPVKAPPQDLSDQSAPNLFADSCAGCGGGLFAIQGGGKFVTVPEDGGLSVTYHMECFKCAVCDGTFSEVSGGKAAFVRANGGACHVEYPPEGTNFKQQIPRQPITTLAGNIGASFEESCTKLPCRSCRSVAEVTVEIVILGLFNNLVLKVAINLMAAVITLELRAVLTFGIISLGIGNFLSANPFLGQNGPLLTSTTF
ncbi:hypothetical protein C0992_005449 [Termitomyces sp. T32_za158]|nr:hypothetical protein C0992_005449 [Termitomyces sp. T32_za158]